MCISRGGKVKKHSIRTAQGDPPKITRSRPPASGCCFLASLPIPVSSSWAMVQAGGGARRRMFGTPKLDNSLLYAEHELTLSQLPIESLAGVRIWCARLAWRLERDRPGFGDSNGRTDLNFVPAARVTSTCVCLVQRRVVPACGYRALAWLCKHELAEYVPAVWERACLPNLSMLAL